MDDVSSPADDTINLVSPDRARTPSDDSPSPERPAHAAPSRRTGVNAAGKERFGSQAALAAPAEPDSQARQGSNRPLAGTAANAPAASAARGSAPPAERHPTALSEPAFSLPALSAALTDTAEVDSATLTAIASGALRAATRAALRRHPHVDTLLAFFHAHPRADVWAALATHCPSGRYPEERDNSTQPSQPSGAPSWPGARQLQGLLSIINATPAALLKAAVSRLQEESAPCVSPGDTPTNDGAGSVFVTRDRASTPDPGGAAAALARPTAGGSGRKRARDKEPRRQLCMDDTTASQFGNTTVYFVEVPTPSDDSSAAPLAADHPMGPAAPASRRRALPPSAEFIAALSDAGGVAAVSQCTGLPGVSRVRPPSAIPPTPENAAGPALPRSAPQCNSPPDDHWDPTTSGDASLVELGRTVSTSSGIYLSLQCAGVRLIAANFRTPTRRHSPHVPLPDWGGANYFQKQCAALFIHVSPDRVQYQARRHGLADPTLAAAAIGISPLELSAALEWSSYFLRTGTTLDQTPFTTLPFQAAHVWAAVTAHCLMHTDDVDAHPLSEYDRLLEVVTPARLVVQGASSPYFARPTDSSGRPATFQALCRLLGLDCAPERDPRGEHARLYERLSLTGLSAEQRAAVRWAAWAGTASPSSMAAHVMLLHRDDLSLLTQLARTPADLGRRGDGSLYGTMVRMVYRGLTTFALPKFSSTLAVPAAFPAGANHHAIPWITTRMEDSLDELLPLCAGEAVAIVLSFGDNPEVGGHFPRSVRGGMLLAPAATTLPATEGRPSSPRLRHVDPDTWDVHRYYARDARLWPMVRNAANIWDLARHPHVLDGQTRVDLSALKRHLLLTVVPGRDTPRAPPLHLSASHLRMIRQNARLGATSVGNSLQRARIDLTVVDIFAAPSQDARGHRNTEEERQNRMHASPASASPDAADTDTNVLRTLVTLRRDALDMATATAIAAAAQRVDPQHANRSGSADLIRGLAYAIATTADNESSWTDSAEPDAVVVSASEPPPVPEPERTNATDAHASP